MARILLAALAALALVPAAAQARPGEPDRNFGRRGTVTLKAADADAVGGAVKVIAGNRILAGGAAAGQFVIVKLRASGSLDRSFGTSGQVVPALPGTTLDGVRAISTFRDGRIYAAGTLESNGVTRMVVLRLLPSGEVDPSFGGGFGYVQVGPSNARLESMTTDGAGNVVIGGSRRISAGNESPIVIRLLPDGTADPAFGANGFVDVGPLGLLGRATSLLVRSDGTITLTVGPGSDRVGPATFYVVKLLPTGAPDTTFAGTGVAVVPFGPGSGTGIGAFAVSRGPSTTTLVAGTDLTSTGTPRGAVIRLRADGSLDPRFGRRGIARLSRSGREIRFTSMTRDSRGRILIAGTGQPPDSLLVRLRERGSRDRSFGNGGLTYPVLGHPPGGAPVYTTFNALDNAGSRAVVVGSAAGPGQLVRGSGSGTLFNGRFALTVSRFQ
ncbi:MAG TPA: hypothetical protein VFZ00_23395 [Solirubrobacter sp.]|nr:hypothetical protein [Solirubrobacter sp.]